MNSKISGVLQIAAVYIGTIVGAGFATGREIVEFFSQYGFIGFLGMMIAGILFVFLGTKVMLLAVSLKAKSYQEVNLHLFGQKWGYFINGLFFFMLFGVTAVMLSGAGAVFEEQLHLSKQLGVILTAILTILVLYNGVQGLFAVNVVVVPIMILFCLQLFFQGISNPSFFQDFFYIPSDVNHWKSIISPFLYSAFNIGLAQAVLVPVAYEVNDRTVIKYGGILGGICLTLILVASHVALVTVPDAMAFDIPNAMLMKNLAQPFYWIFIIVMYGEIFTSLVGNVFGLEKQVKRYVKMNSLLIFICILTLAYFASIIQYRTLLSFLYPIFGYVCLLFLILLLKSKHK